MAAVIDVEVVVRGLYGALSLLKRVSRLMREKLPFVLPPTSKCGLSFGGQA